jgi:hypothetical protein
MGTLVVKGDASGNVRWQKTNGLPYTPSSSTYATNHLQVAVATPNSGFLLAGNADQNIPSTTTMGYYGLTVKGDAEGQMLSQQTYGRTISSGPYGEVKISLPSPKWRYAGLHIWPIVFMFIPGHQRSRLHERSPPLGRPGSRLPRS